jgi:hypothetical protein
VASKARLSAVPSAVLRVLLSGVMAAENIGAAIVADTVEDTGAKEEAREAAKTIRIIWHRIAKRHGDVPFCLWHTSVGLG